FSSLLSVQFRARIFKASLFGKKTEALLLAANALVHRFFLRVVFSSSVPFAAILVRSIAVDTSNAPPVGIRGSQSAAVSASRKDFAQAVQIQNAREGLFLHDRCRKRGFFPLHRENFLLHRIRRDKTIRHHRLRLTDAM